MSEIHLIFTKEKCECLSKSRYLKFTEYGYNQKFFIYIRYVYTNNQEIKWNRDRSQYQVSDDYGKLLKCALSHTDELYWSTVQLTNHISEKEICGQYLTLIENKAYTSLLFSEDLTFKLNFLYKLNG